MKVLYDMTYTQGSRFYSGLYEYGKKNLLNKCDKCDVLVSNKYSVDDYLKNNYKLRYISSKKSSKQFVKDIYKLSFEYDVIYFPYQLTNLKLKINKNCKMIFTIHDLAQLDLALVNKTNKYEKLYLSSFKDKLRYLLKMGLRRTHIWHHKLYSSLKHNIKVANKIIVVSNATKDDVIKRFNVSSEKVNVCYSPIKEFSVKESNLSYSNYFLFVSASRYTKNCLNAIKAFDMYKENTKSDKKFIITGNLPANILNISKYKDDIINLKYLEDYDLEYLYKNADCLIFSSFYEGFGMPPLEAMKYGTKVICSNLSCLKEIYKNALFFNPFDVYDIYQQLINLDKLSKSSMIENYKEIEDKCNKALDKHSEIIFS